MSHHQGQFAGRAAQQLGGPPRRPLDRQPVESEAPDAIFAMPAPGHWIEELLLAECRVERGIEGRDLRDIRQRRASGLDGGGRHRVVQRRELGKCLDPLQNPVVDPHRRYEPGPAVHHAMPNGLDRINPLDPQLR